MLYGQIRELAGWGWDQGADRGDVGAVAMQARGAAACAIVRARENYRQNAAILQEETEALRPCLREREGAVAASGEFDGLNWELGIIDLRALLAFQRRIQLSPDGVASCAPVSWEQRFDLALPLVTPPQFSLSKALQDEIVVKSKSPNVNVRFITARDSFNTFRLQVTSGSPYLEVAMYRQRWFLRDGYHRCFSLLCAGVHQIPAVIIRARSLEELGADAPHFFEESVLFCDQPPMVTDFLDDELTLCYFRAVHEKTWRIVIQEMSEPARVMPEEELAII